MSPHPASAHYRELEHQLAYWNQFRQAQPRPGGAPAETDVELFPLSGKGTIYSFTTVTAPGADFEAFAPYPLALIQLDEGPIITAQLTDVSGPVEIGQRVEMVIRKLRTDGARGIIVYGPKFRPLLQPED